MIPRILTGGERTGRVGGIEPLAPLWRIRLGAVAAEHTAALRSAAPLRCVFRLAGAAARLHVLALDRHLQHVLRGERVLGAVDDDARVEDVDEPADTLDVTLVLLLGGRWLGRVVAIVVGGWAAADWQDGVDVAEVIGGEARLYTKESRLVQTQRIFV